MDMIRYVFYILISMILIFCLFFNQISSGSKAFFQKFLSLTFPLFFQFYGYKKSSYCLYGVLNLIATNLYLFRINKNNNSVIFIRYQTFTAIALKKQDIKAI